MTTADPVRDTDRLDKVLSLAGNMGIGAVIAVLLITQIMSKLDTLIARVGDVVQACATH